MKLQAHVIMNLALGLSVGIGASACQKTGKTSKDRIDGKTVTDTPVQPDWSHHFPGENKPDGISEPVVEPVPTVTESRPRRDPCHGCGMG
jgi:hypothetical protein